MSSFKGQFRYTLDAKGRINIPAKFRKSMDPAAMDSFVITRGLEGCLFAYPLDEWSKIEEKLRQLPLTQRDNRLFVRIMTSNASESQFDKQGRIGIPQFLIEQAQIQKEVLIIGALDRLEIWNPEVYQAYLDSSSESYESVAEKIAL